MLITIYTGLYNVEGWGQMAYIKIELTWIWIHAPTQHIAVLYFFVTWVDDRQRNPNINDIKVGN